jgi:hypothetical protein
VDAVDNAILLDNSELHGRAIKVRAALRRALSLRHDGCVRCASGRAAVGAKRVRGRAEEGPPPRGVSLSGVCAEAGVRLEAPGWDRRGATRLTMCAWLLPPLDAHARRAHRSRASAQTCRGSSAGVGGGAAEAGTMAAATAMRLAGAAAITGECHFVG